MKENKGFFFVLYLVIFLAIALFLKINGRFLLSHELRFPSVNDFLIRATVSSDSVQKKKTEEFAPVDDFLENYSILDKNEEELTAYIDSLMAASNSELNLNDIKASPFLINYPVNGVYPLDAFFEKLSTMDTCSQLFRVGHYGDSQIEGDRMTYNLRKFFASQFPGGGVGYIPMQDVTSPVTYTRNADNSWIRYTVMKNRIKGYAYGPGGSVYRYAPAAKATCRLNLSKSYKKAFLLYGFGSDSSFLDVYASGSKLLGSYNLGKTSSFTRLPLTLASNETVLNFVFRGPSPAIYGFTFDNDKGIQFDNYGIRGQAGDGLLLIPQSQLVQMFEQTNTCMAIMQFGGNVVTGLTNPKMATYYGDIYKKLYLYYKSALKNGSILIFGINDVSRPVNGTYQSYPNIGALRDLQRKAAVENGMAFYDIYQLMGGENSIKIWNEKGLASKDGHYSDRGREIVCREICKALWFEYQKYLKRKNSTS